ncbi:hypothetical protein ACFSQP_06005 [Bizionia sediminis]|uniref:DUF3108 domain-containing protein n=1 Tax=Bizionia sediminis TaxID=1737064 RepID=A0ABW5KQR8_9FLAO
MKRNYFIALLILLSINSYSQINVADKSKEPVIKGIPYDGSFMNFSNMMLTKEQKAGVVGEKITLFKVWTVKNADGSNISYTDSEKFENKTFEVIEYMYEYKDILKIKNEDEVFLFEPSLTDEYVFNSFLDTIKMRLENKFLIPLKLKSEMETIKGDKIQIDGLKEYLITEVTFAKLPSGFGIVVKLNGEFEVIYPTGTFDQLEDKGLLNLESSDIFKTKSMFIKKEYFKKFSEFNRIYLSSIRNGKVEIGMTEKQCILSWGIPTNSMNNIAGYDNVLIYGDTGNSQNLYFKKGILKLIK